MSGIRPAWSDASPPQLGLTRSGSLRPCTIASPTASGCVSSSPTAAPNQFMSPLRYGTTGRDVAFKRVRAQLAAGVEDFQLLSADSADYIHAVSEDGDLELHFLPPEDDGSGFVTFRLISAKPSVMRPFCASRGCVNGNTRR